MKHIMILATATILLGGCSKPFPEFSAGYWTDARVQRKDTCVVYIYFPSTGQMLMAEIEPTSCEQLPKVYNKK